MQITLKHKPVEERPYRCSICPDKGYARKNHLDNHNMLKHSNEKNFVCSICGKAFKVAYNLWHHERDYHKEGGKKAKFYEHQQKRNIKRYSTPEIVKK